MSFLAPTFLTSFFFFNDTATTEIYTLSLHDALPISRRCAATASPAACGRGSIGGWTSTASATRKAAGGAKCEGTRSSPDRSGTRGRVGRAAEDRVPHARRGRTVHGGALSAAHRALSRRADVRRG